MKQGEIWKVYFDPVRGREQAGVRPALVISGNTMNSNGKLAIVCPLTTSIHNFKGNPVISPSTKNGLKKTSEVLVFQVRTLSGERFKKKIGVLSNEVINEVQESLNKLLKF